MSSLAGLAGDLAAAGASTGITRLLLSSRLASIGEITLDAAVKETHKASAKATRHPVEAETGQASTISDHVVVDPLSISIDGVISNHPVVALGTIAALLSGTGYDPAKDAYERLLEYILTGAVVTVITTLKTYPGMVLEDVSVTRDAAKGNALHFTATAVHLPKVSLKGSIAAQERLPTQSTGNKGKVTPKAATEAQTTKTSAGFKALKAAIPSLPTR